MTRTTKRTATPMSQRPAANRTHTHGSGRVTLPELGAIDDHSKMMIQFGYALQNTGKHIYAGTVPYPTKVRRRTANKRARAARRAGRR